MPLSKAHKAQSRARIVEAAGRLFRTHGFEGVGVDAIMAEAGLTRGGFYNHFPTKSALFAEVLGADYGLVRQLSDREVDEDGDLTNETQQIFRNYLNPDHLHEVGPGCTFAALAGDAARADGTARTRFTETYRRMVEEMGRVRAGERAGENQGHEVLALAIGAVSIARVLDDAALKAELLNAAARRIDEWLAEPSGPGAA